MAAPQPAASSGLRLPAGFSVASVPQKIPCRVIAQIEAFIRIFDRVTTRPPWQESVPRTAPAIARLRRTEVCFFSAWDFHIPATHPEGWQLIEFNDNGSGFLFAALINRTFYERSGAPADIEAPLAFPAFAARVTDMVEKEAARFHGRVPDGLFLILDDAQSLQHGRFRDELVMLRDLFRRRGWQSDLSSPAELDWDGKVLRQGGRAVAFVVNRSTDFFWEAEAYAALRAAYLCDSVYVAPSPFTYATRSDKRLLALLSRPERDQELGIEADERAELSAHVPETHQLREENLDEIVRRKDEFVFKPAHGFAGRGVLASSQVGRSRLRRLLKQDVEYVAQRVAPKSCIRGVGPSGSTLWTDLRVWAYRGECFLISGRASVRPDSIDLTPPGGWIPTFVEVEGHEK